MSDLDHNILTAPIKLQHPFPNVNYFDDNQVLTANQLNSVIHHLSNQERLTRVWLLGTGIVCGLKISVKENAITISAGCGVTTDGDLLTLAEERTFLQCRIYNDDKGNYANNGISLQGEEEEEDVFELVDDLTPFSEEFEEDIQPLSKEFHQNRVVVLYLESYLNKAEVCSIDNCDNSQQIQRNNLRVLLVPSKPITGLEKSNTDQLREIPEFLPTRVNIQTGLINNRSDLQQRFANALDITTITPFKTQGNDKSLEAILVLYGNILNSATSSQNYSFTSNLPTTPSHTSVTLTFQKIYCFYNTLAQALAEFREALFQACGGCIPDIADHPKHLLLGYTKNTPEVPPIELRHGFRAASNKCQEQNAFQRPILLWNRLVQLVEAFEPDTNPTQIGIFPCKSSSVSLGERSIPSYFGSNYKGLWNIDRYLQGYNNPATLPYTNDTRFSKFCGGVDFYRIEGIHGQPVDTAEKSLEALKLSYNLDFKILSVQVEKTTRWIKFPSVRFPDLETLYTKEQKKTLDKLNNLKLYTTELKKFLDSKTSADFEEKNIDFDNLNLEIRTLQGSVSKAIGASQEKLYSSYTSAPKTKDYHDSLKETLLTSSKINERVGIVSPSVFQNPIDEIEKSKPDLKLNLIDGIYRKRWTKIAELSTFEKFAQRHSGMEPLCGVPKGGTIILVYVENEDEDQREVIMDFCLPSCCEIKLEDVEVEEDQEEKPSIKPLPIPIDPSVFIPRPIPYPHPFPEPISVAPPIWEETYTKENIETWRDKFIQGAEINKIIDQRQDIFTQEIESKVDTKISGSFKAFDLIGASVSRAAATENKTRFEQDFSNGTIKDTDNVEMLGVNLKLDQLQQEQNMLESIINSGKANSQTRDRLAQIEEESAEVVKNGLEILSADVAAADTENRGVGSNFGKFMTNAELVTSKITNEEAQKKITTAIEANSANLTKSGYTRSLKTIQGNSSFKF